MPKHDVYVKAFSVRTPKGGVVNDYHLSPSATPEQIEERKQKAMQLAKNKVQTFGELEVVVIEVHTRRIYKPRKVNLEYRPHPMSEHIRDRMQFNDDEVVPPPNKLEEVDFQIPEAPEDAEVISHGPMSQPTTREQAQRLQILGNLQRLGNSIHQRILRSAPFSQEREDSDRLQA